MKKSFKASLDVNPSEKRERDLCVLPLYRSVRWRHPPYEACSNGILFLLLPVRPSSGVASRTRVERVFQNTIDLKVSSGYSHKGERL